MSSGQSSTAKTSRPFRRIPSIRHADAVALQRRGLALGRRGRLVEAASCCRQALQLRPHFPAAHFCLGRVFARRERWSQAVDCFETALRQRPKLPAVLNRLGLALAELDRWEEAIACYPSMRLFRQKVYGDWRNVFLRLTAALKLECRRPVRLRPITIEVSPGELLDKISILEIKRRRICDPEKRRNVRFELASLQSAWRALVFPPNVRRLTRELRAVNETLWKIEDAVRRCEQKGDFGPDFIRLARSVYRNNDRRARLKRQINESLGSPLVEEKSLPDTAARRNARPTSKHVRRTRET